MIVTESNKLRTPTPGHSAWSFTPEGSSQVKEFDLQPCFWSFLPGIAGFDGVPLWAMYVNRGQAISSFGYLDKDHAVCEFFPATSAAQLTGTQGFRTFIREDDRLIEPFGSRSRGDRNVRRRMTISLHDLVIEEEDEDNQLSVRIQYCGAPNSPTPALLRKVEITNTSSSERELEILDGLPVIVPAGVNDHSMKRLRRITEAFCRVKKPRDGVIQAAPPYSTSDTAHVTQVAESTFYGGFVLDAEGSFSPCSMIADPDVVFGADDDLIYPRAFMNGFDPASQLFENRLPSAFAHLKKVIPAGGTVTVYRLTGYARSLKALEVFLDAFAQPEALDRIPVENRKVVEKLVEPGTIVTALPELNGYARQNLLDNILRGGTPVLIPSSEGKRAIHVFCRRHGDMERDYNDFSLPVHPYSDGSGNYRDILQNRRHDVWFYPSIGTCEIEFFLSLIQPDGYNPLSITGWRWRLKDAGLVDSLAPTTDKEALAKLRALVSGWFSPGEVLLWAAEEGVECTLQSDWFVKLLRKCESKILANHGEPGNWVDHWTYLIDMFEAYEGFFPDKMMELLVTGNKVGWYLPNARIGMEPVTDARMATMPELSVLGKLLTMLFVKSATFDREGRAVEMEAGRPGWNDALNGLPGIGGSSTGELVEVGRFADWLLRQNIWDEIDSVDLPEPAGKLIDALEAVMAPNGWDYERSLSARHAWQQAVYSDASIEASNVSAKRCRELLQSISDFVQKAARKSLRDSDGLMISYYYRNFGEGEDKTVAHPLPAFLESQVHLLRILYKGEEKRALHEAIRNSALYDEKLDMYLLNESLDSCPPQIGRARTFTPGIFENESVWIHMSYKYYVELLRGGLYEEFFEAARTGLVPFMDPAVYGRSILENSSYIVSSRSREKALHGRGYVARLSGSTAEFVHLWNSMSVGERPFELRGGVVVFSPNPVLPAEWFLGAGETREIQWNGRTEMIGENQLAFAFAGKTLVVYHNPQRVNTWELDGSVVRGYRVDGGERVDAEFLDNHNSLLLRSGKIGRLDVHLG